MKPPIPQRLLHTATRDDRARQAAQVLHGGDSPNEWLDRAERSVRARLAALGHLRACVLCGEDHTPSTPIRSTPQTILVTDPAHPAFRRVLAPGAWTCTPCYDATVSL